MNFDVDAEVTAVSRSLLKADKKSQKTKKTICK